MIDGKDCVVEFEPDSNLRDTEQIPLLHEGGIEQLSHYLSGNLYSLLNMIEY